MDPLSLGFLLLVVLLGGVIAYVADRMGRQIGKKRLTVFGMRPRHTALLITIGAGVLIPVVTVLLVMAVSRDVREWIVEGRAAIAQRNQALRELETTIEQRNEAQEELEALELQAQGLNLQINQLGTDLKRSEAQSVTFSKQAKRAQADVQRLERRSNELTREITALNRRITEVNSQLKSRTAELQTLTDQRNVLQQNLTAANQELDDIQRRNQELTSENAELEKQLEAKQSDVERLQTQIASADTAIQRTQKEIGELRREQTALMSARDELQNDVIVLQEQLNDINRQLRFAEQLLAGNVEFTRGQPLIFSLGEELVRFSVPPNQSEPEAMQALQRVLTLAELVAEREGARGRQLGEGSRIPAASMRDLRLGDGRDVTVQEQQQQVINQLVGKSESQTLVVRSLYNTFAGEPTPVSVQVFDNPQVFRQGETIAEARINGAADPAVIFNEVRDFLQTRVQAEARKRGMISQPGPEESFGELSPEEIIKLVNSIRQTGRPVRVSVQAAEDTRRADKLRLVFRIN